MVVCFSGLGSLNLREASNLTPEPLVWHVKSKADLSAQPTISSQPDDS